LPPIHLQSVAATLNAATLPFHVINYLGSLGGGRVLGRSGMARLMDRQANPTEGDLISVP
jgi:hypothetical protein